MKYVMFKIEKGDHQMMVPVIFPNMLNHDETAKIMRALIHRTLSNVDTVEPVSAGFINLAGDTHGKSETLKMEAHPDDKLIINTFDYTHGVGLPR